MKSFTLHKLVETEETIWYEAEKQKPCLLVRISFDKKSVDCPTSDKIVITFREAQYDRSEARAPPSGQGLDLPSQDL